MNERINGLWWKARIGYNNQNCDPEVLEKFAELIVKECARVAFATAIGDGTPDEIYDAIKETFRS
jgi:hypothetical protein